MNDQTIVQRFWEREETAIPAARAQYGAYCLSIARRILFQPQDAEEAVQDTWLAAWNSMPPNRPAMLRTYLGKLTRRISLKKARACSAQKRGGGELPLVLDELEECVAGAASVESEVRQKELASCIDRFLAALPDEERRVFIRRYWWMEPVQEISRQLGYSQSKVKSMLYRLRRRLRIHLEQEGFEDEA